MRVNDGQRIRLKGRGGAGRHGGPADRGRADAYYGRVRDPHKYERGTYSSPRVVLTHPDEIKAYCDAYDNEPDRKDWG